MSVFKTWRWLVIACGLGLIFSVAGCKGIPKKSEIQARRDVVYVESKFNLKEGTAKLPQLGENSTLADLMIYAMLNSPDARASYYNWVASVEQITVERSLPDPRLTFEMDIMRVVQTLMPGAMFEIPGRGKLEAKANVASEESRIKYYVFESAVLNAAYNVKRVYYQLWFLEEKIKILRNMLELIAEIEKAARFKNESGFSTVQDILQAQIEQEKLKAEIKNLEDSRRPLIMMFKGALGIKPFEPDPPIPARFEFTPLDISEDKLLETALAKNPSLRAMESEIKKAEVSIQLAVKAKIPDFSVGLESDLYAAPVMYRPSFVTTIPLWRDKIAAQVSAAQAQKGASESRLSSEQIKVAIDLAEKMFTYRETSRLIELGIEELLPRARQSTDVAKNSYVTGKTDYLSVLESWKTLFEIELNILEARIRRELAVAELMFIVGIFPAGAPILPE